MNTQGIIRKIFKRPIFLVALTLMFSIPTFLGGCNEGGTSTEAGNPGLTLQIRGIPNNEPFHGFVQFFVKDANPTFFTAPPDDGFAPPDDGFAHSQPKVSLGNEEVSTIVLNKGNTFSINRDLLANLVNTHPIQPLFKSASNMRSAAPFPQFNVVLIGFDNSSGLLTGIRPDTLIGKAIVGKFRYEDYSGGDTLFVDVTPSKTYAGTIDTSGLKSPALGLFVPGTPYYSVVQGDSFHFADMPAGKLPLRLVSKNGSILEILDSLGTTLTHSLKLGKKVDSVALPDPNPSLDPPTAKPSGQYAFTDSVTVTLSAESGSTLYYTLDGSTPDLNTKRYSSPLVLHASATLKAIAVMKGHNRSPISVNNYVLVPASPSANPKAKSFHDSIPVTLTVPDKNNIIFFSLDGSEPSPNSTKYQTPILIKSTLTLKAISFSPGLGSSRTMEEKYTQVNDSIPIK